MSPDEDAREWITISSQPRVCRDCTTQGTDVVSRVTQEDLWASRYVLSMSLQLQGLGVVIYPDISS